MLQYKQEKRAKTKTTEQLGGFVHVPVLTVKIWSCVGFMMLGSLGSERGTERK